MNTVTLEVCTLADTLRDAGLAMQADGPPAATARISFASPELLWRVLTAKRWELLRALAGAGPVTLREVARRVRRDVKAVHADIHALLDAGIVDRDDSGKIVFAYDSVHVDFLLNAA